MMDGQLYSLAERFVLSFEKIAAALEGLNETYRQHFGKLFPERKEGREAVITRIPTEEDLIREMHGASEEWFDERGAWASGPEETEEDIGEREREWLERQNQAKRHAGAERFP